MRISTNARLAACLLLIGLVSSACTSTNYLRPDYAPRLSAQSVELEDIVRRDPPQSIGVLEFADRRSDRDGRYNDPKLVWKGKGVYEYRFAAQSVSDFLRRALVFDLKRLGFQIETLEGSSPEGSTRPSVPSPFVLGVDVLECRPEYDTGFASVTPEYRYEYRIRLWDRPGKLIVDETISENIKGVAEPGISFATLMDRLLNDHLSSYNMKLADRLLRAIRETKASASSNGG